MSISPEEKKEIVAVATPFVKIIIDQYIGPKIKQLIDKKGVSFKITAHSFENQFQAYLLDCYDKYSATSILALDNQKKYIKDIYIPLEVISSGKNEEKHLITGFSNDFIPKHKKVLIIDTAGMGKSTISKWLFLSAVEIQVGVPLLIELRRLKKDIKMVDEILRQLSMLNEKADEKFVLELLAKGGFIFMLDGFDEIEHDERKFVVEDIRDFIDKARKNYFLLTSRPEDALGVFGDFTRFKIRPLKKEEAYSLLEKYDDKGETSKLLISKLEEKSNENVKEFLTNPLLVSLLFSAFEYKNTIPLKKHMFYRQVYDAFFDRHDLTKGQSYTRNKYTKLESDDFHRVLRFIGYYCLTANKVEFSKDELIGIINEAKKFCADLKFNSVDFLKDVLTKVPLFVEDGLYIKWSHKSIQEYFAANFIFTDSKSKQGKILSTIAMSSKYRYFNVMDIYYSLDYKSYRRYFVHQLLNDYLTKLNELRRIWPDIDPIVATKLFAEKFLLIKHKDAKHGESVFKLLEKWREENNTEESWGSYAMFHENEKNYDYLKILHSPTVKSSVLSSLFAKGFDFVGVRRAPTSQRKAQTEPSSDYKFLDLEENKFHQIGDNEVDSVFKKVDVNLIFNSFSPYGIFIDESKAKATLKSIGKEIAQEQSEDFLMQGLD